MDTNKIYTKIISNEVYYNHIDATPIPTRRRELNLDPDLIEKAKQDRAWIAELFGLDESIDEKPEVNQHRRREINLDPGLIEQAKQDREWLLKTVFGK